MAFRRQVLNLLYIFFFFNLTMNRTKRLNSLILSPQDLGKSIDLPEIKITIQS